MLSPPSNVILSCWNGGDKTENREGVIPFGAEASKGNPQQAATTTR